ncbi:MAG: hypothetical protein QOI77_656 [Blastocatellia bacterium]|nr:hypothetical protein [Blastocatellia bacterium]
MMSPKSFYALVKCCLLVNGIYKYKAPDIAGSSMSVHYQVHCACRQAASSRVTLHPTRAANVISISRLNSSHLPLIKSDTLDRAIFNFFAAAGGVRPLDWIYSRKSLICFAHISRIRASAGSNPRSANTFPLDFVIVELITYLQAAGTVASQARVKCKSGLPPSLGWEIAKIIETRTNESRFFT